MRTFLASLAVVTVAALGLLAAENQQFTDLRIQNHTDSPALILDKDSAQTAPLLSAYVGGSLTFAVPATGLLPVTYGGTGAATPAAALTAVGLKRGTFTNAANGTFTNTFAAPFTAVPVVVITPQGNPGGTYPYLSEVTTNGFKVAAGPTNIVFSWVAVLP